MSRPAAAARPATRTPEPSGSPGGTPRPGHRWRALARSLAVVPLVAAVALVGAPGPAAADHRQPAQISLVTGSLPEGIAAGPRGTFFAGARADGDVYVGDVRTGEVTRLVDRSAPLAAVGMFYDRRSGLLWVAGGGPGFGTGIGTITAYRGSQRVYEEQVPGAGFLNDVAVTRDAVYVTDTFGGTLAVVPLGRRGAPAGEPVVKSLTGLVPGVPFRPNGIRELPGGDLVVVSAGILYAVDPVTFVADRIEVDGRALAGGDGLELNGRTLYVVNGYGGNEVVVLRVSPHRGTARTLGVLTDPSLDRPTTAAVVRGALYVVNGRFGTLATNPQAPVSVTRLPLRP